MATKAKVAQVKDFYAGATVYVVWLGYPELAPEVTRVASRPYKDRISIWVKTYDRFQDSKESLESIGVLGGSGRITFTTARAAAKYCKTMQGGIGNVPNTALNLRSVIQKTAGWILCIASMTTKNLRLNKR